MCSHTTEFHACINSCIRSVILLNFMPALTHAFVQLVAGCTVMPCSSYAILKTSIVLQVKALEAADAARRKEAARNADRIKQKGTLDKQRAERAKVTGAAFVLIPWLKLRASQLQRFS